MDHANSASAARLYFGVGRFRTPNDDGTNPVRLYAKGVRAHPEDIAKYNLVVFGDLGSTRWIAKVDGKTRLLAVWCG